MKRTLIAILLAVIAALAAATPTLAQSKATAGPQPAAAAKSEVAAPPAATNNATRDAAGAGLLSRLLPTGDAGAAAGDGTATGRIVQMAAVLTALSIAPALLIMATSFTRFLIAFSFLRAGLGLQGSPPNIVLITLSLFMTFYVMSPAFDKAWEEGGKPLIENRIGEQEAFTKIVAPFEQFMRANVREKDLKMFEDLAAAKPAADAPQSSIQLRTLVPAFIVSELRRGFEIGFLILLPFLVIDLLVATLVMSMGMMMLSPTVFSLPCKVLFFVLIDGWGLIVHGLVRSFV